MSATGCSPAPRSGETQRRRPKSRRRGEPAPGGVSRRWLRTQLGLLTLALGLFLAACQPQPKANTDLPLAGAELYHRLACHGCHSRHGSGGMLGPPLDHLERHLSRAEVAKQLLTPRQRHAESRMPSFAFVRPQEFQNLLNFLQPTDE
jgi:mono/diheme cytochrome c family protein